MHLFVLNELGLGVFLTAEHDSEGDRITVRFYSKKPSDTRHCFHSDHLRNGYNLHLGDRWPPETTLDLDVTGLEVAASTEVERDAYGLIVKLKIKNGTHSIETIGFAPPDGDDGTE